MKRITDNKLNIKSENGFTVQDLLIAIFIIMLFAALISTTMFSVYKNNAKVNVSAQMATYAVQILDSFSKIPWIFWISSLKSCFFSL